MHMEIAESDFLFNGGADSCHPLFFLPHPPFLDMEVIMTSVPSQKEPSGYSPEDGNHVLKWRERKMGGIRYLDNTVDFHTFLVLLVSKLLLHKKEKKIHNQNKSPLFLIHAACNSMQFSFPFLVNFPERCLLPRKGPGRTESYICASIAEE